MKNTIYKGSYIDVRQEEYKPRSKRLKSRKGLARFHVDFIYNNINGKVVNKKETKKTFLSWVE